MTDASPTCARHPEVPTRLRCSACDTPICTDCAAEAAVGYKCPDCIAGDRGDGRPGPGSGRTRWIEAVRSAGARDASAGVGREPDTSGAEAGGLPTDVLTRAVLVGGAATVVGGLLMVPILLGGTLLLISSGVIGWGVARSVYWATDERNSPTVRTLALAFAGSTVLLAILFGGGGEVTGLEALALPAAVYGGWIVVRQR